MSCGKNPATHGKRCDVCWQKHLAQKREVYRWLNEHNLCIYCQTEPRYRDRLCRSCWTTREIGRLVYALLITGPGRRVCARCKVRPTGTRYAWCAQCRAQSRRQWRKRNNRKYRGQFVARVMRILYGELAS